MRKLALIAFAAVVAVTGAASTATAALSDRDGTVWHPKSDVQLAGRGGNRGGRNDGGRGRDARRDRGDDVIWRLRDRKHRPFFLFRRDRGPDCFVKKVQVRDAMGNVVIKSVRTCE